MLETAAILLAVFILIAFLSAAREGKKAGGKTETIQYNRAPSLLTAAEVQFYETLRETIRPQEVIQCKVRLADVLIAPKQDLSAFRRVSQKHVDFLLCDRTSLKPLLAIELDDSSHQRRDRQKRDEFIDKAYQSAGLPVIHIPVQTVYEAERIRALTEPHTIRV